MYLQALSEAIGISGREDAVRDIVLEAIAGHVDDIRINAMGGVTAIKKGTGENLPRVMIDAHMDEIGFMVMGFDGNGLIRFSNVGGVDARILPGLRVKVGADLIPGVIVWPPIHKGRSQNVVEIDNLRIDIGATSKEGASSKVKQGERIAFDTQFMELGTEMLRGKSFDDRVGCSLLIDLVRGGPYPVDVLVSFSVQEEIGLRGARVAARRLKPDVAFALEGTTAHDLPNPMGFDDDGDARRDDLNGNCRVGDGPALTVMDRSMMTDPRLLEFLRTTGDQNDIPYQLKTRVGGGTDAGAIHLTDAGCPSAVVSVPCRYIHSPAALMKRSDYDNTLRLLQTALHAMTFEVLKR